ncbi:MAG: cob(I)yrinic acid a,c-diamide adenosyltransferase [Nitrososphaerales archaeon]
MTKFYTGSGDKGETSLLKGVRVGKDDIRIEALGELDEANSMIGLSRSFVNLPEINSILEAVQQDFFLIGLDVISPISESRVNESMVKVLEEHLNILAKALPDYRRFVLPNGTPAVASLYLARSVVRRAERIIVKLSRTDSRLLSSVKYLNRLSSLLYVAARYTALKSGVVEKEWISGNSAK